MRSPNHCIRLVLVVLLALAVWVLPGSGSLAAEGEPEWNLTIFHTNDMHGAFLPEPASWRDDRAEVGGVIALASHLADQRQSTTASLLLDAGDFMTGNPICVMAEDNVLGAGFVQMMNAIGYDVGVIGNHEFDNGRDNAWRLPGVAAFPLLAADILDENGEPEFAHEPVIRERGGLKIGIMGVSCAGLLAVAAHSHTAGLSMREQARAVREMIAELDPATDLLILITHNGVDGDDELAVELVGSGLDLIVGGHSHTRLNEPLVVGDILIVQAGSHIKNLGRLDLRVEDDRVVAHRGELIQLVAAGATAGPELTALVSSYQQRLDEEFGVVIGNLVSDWRRDGGESNIGDWLTDRIRERCAADVAFLNSGTIRKNLVAGPITLLDIHEILPFSNTLVTCELTGAELTTILTTNAESQAGRGYPRLQVSGLRYGFRQVGDHVELVDVTVGGEPLRQDAVYRVGTADYVISMSGRYFGFQVLDVEDVGIGLTDAIVAAVQEAGTIDAVVDGRIQAPAED
ncbi:MAG: bifunctional UDP-sugar hydrolase/5'-nucleotidase [bacterium]